MIVYHGTGPYSLERIRQSGLEIRQYAHVQQPCACVTTDFDVASVFAIRGTPVVDFLRGNITGVVCEFELSGTEHTPVRDSHCLQDEAEIAIFDPTQLTLLALWTYDGTKWQRTVIA